jgi:glutamate N-acetyltransferase/amino-acid N-acetyltransferase
MINPRMATMLAFLTTDANLPSELLQKLLRQDVDRSFNQISVDGDTSTNDTVAILANGAAGGSPILENSSEALAFSAALNAVTTKLSRMLARDGEGATKLIECIVAGAPDPSVANAIAKTVIQSDLVKTAVFGADANWGRVLCAVGYTKGHFDVDNTDIHLSSRAGTLSVCQGSAAVSFDEELAREILNEEEIRIDIHLHDGMETGRAYGCDLTYGYVKINGMYRT